jgi:hypothetical protein
MTEDEKLSVGSFIPTFSTLVVYPVRVVQVTVIETIAYGRIALVSTRITWLIDFYPRPFVFLVYVLTEDNLYC